jgi:hypothetical protein
MESLIVMPDVAIINKINWKIMLALEKIILMNGGNIFGGFVRDKILHDSAADTFYEYMEKENIITRSSEFQLKYNDVTFLPEANDRCVLPSDIDCFMRTSELKKMISHLNKNNYNVKTKRDSSANLYFFKNSDDENISRLKHAKLTITLECNDMLFDIFNMSDFKVEMDVIHIDDNDVDMYDILSSNIDFECNSLITDKKMKKISAIISDIKLKRAVVSQRYQKNGYDSLIPVYRWEKMILKGWKPVSPYFEIVKGEEYDGHCIICHDNIDPLKYHIKDIGCDARFHMGCYLKTQRHENFKGECPMCKCYSFINKNEDTLIQMLAVRQDELNIDQIITPINSILSAGIMINNIEYTVDTIANVINLTELRRIADMSINENENRGYNSEVVVLPYPRRLLEELNAAAATESHI